MVEQLVKKYLASYATRMLVIMSTGVPHLKYGINIRLKPLKFLVVYLTPSSLSLFQSIPFKIWDFWVMISCSFIKKSVNLISITVKI
jgi:hypothetical protein